MPVRFVAEVSSNHGKNLDRSFSFIKAAAEVGCDAVKFQLFKVDDLFSPEILNSSSRHRERIDWELPEAFIPKLSNYAHELGLEFACTPFYLDAIDILEPYVDFFKIASYEILWKKLFNKCASTGLPIVFSTGMATLSEIEAAFNNATSSASSEVTLLHCNSTYPTPLSEINLAAMTTLKHYFSDHIHPPAIGWSDHSHNPAVIFRAVHQYDAKMIEFHLDLDGKGAEYATGHCWLPDEISQVISTIKGGFQSDGDGQIGPSKSEAIEREWRADVSDGLRPLINTRKSFRGDG